MDDTPPIRLTVPWPPKQVQPNARTHWAAKHRATKSYKFVIGCLMRPALAEQGAQRLQACEAIDVLIVGHPTVKRRRDLDNLMASCKALLDTLALELGVDDSRFRPRVMLAETAPGEPHLTLLLSEARVMPLLD
jgi:crossover junction endodeoxyribonuclease RusA